MHKSLVLFTIILLLAVGCASSQKNQDTATTGTESATEAKEIQWMTITEAMAKQKANPKKIFMDVYTDWCRPCKMLDKKTFHHPDVVKYVNEHYYPVKFNAEGPDPITLKGKTFINKPRKGRAGTHQFASYLGIRGYPSMIFMDENDDIILPVTGFVNAQDLELYLKFVAKEDYKKIKSEQEWKDYQKNFTPTFR